MPSLKPETARTYAASLHAALSTYVQAEHQGRIAEIETEVRLLRVARPFEVDLQRLKAHLRMVQEDVGRMGTEAVLDPKRPIKERTF